MKPDNINLDNELETIQETYYIELGNYEYIDPNKKTLRLDISRNNNIVGYFFENVPLAKISSRIVRSGMLDEVRNIDFTYTGNTSIINNYFLSTIDNQRGKVGYHFSLKSLHKTLIYTKYDWENNEVIEKEVDLINRLHIYRTSSDIGYAGETLIIHPGYRFIKDNNIMTLKLTGKVLFFKFINPKWKKYNRSDKNLLRNNIISNRIPRINFKDLDEFKFIRFPVVTKNLENLYVFSEQIWINQFLHARDNKDYVLTGNIVLEVIPFEREYTFLKLKDYERE